jgi:putative SOS response-associated peptidase YedK
MTPPTMLGLRPVRGAGFMQGRGGSGRRERLVPTLHGEARLGISFNCEIFSGFWMKEKPKVPHINARAETVHKLPLFREAFAKRRCLIPATGFYEWQQREDGKHPYRFRRKDLEPFAFAGIWEFARLGGEEILSACMIVGQPNPLVGGVHDRMPVMLLADDYDRWLDPTSKTDELLALQRNSLGTFALACLRTGKQK